MKSPAKYTPELAEKIYAHVRRGLSQDKIAALEGMPSKPTLEAWLDEHEEFLDRYFRAKRIWVIGRAEELEALGQSAIDAARDKTIDPKRLNPLVTAINNQAANLRWLISRLFPQRFGDKVQAEISGKDGGPIEAAITVTFVKPGQDGGAAGSC